MFDRIAILAPGLLGASVARAARRRDLAREIRIWARRPEIRLQLQKMDWCDVVCTTPEEAAAGAGLTVLCPPVEHIVPLARQIAPALAAGALVTDVGSVKGEICRLASAAIAAHGGTFVGSHPMAGSEKSGLEHATDDLFQGRPCFVTPLLDTPAEAVDRVAGFWAALGSEIVSTSPEQHDEIVAHVSHLPHLLASTLCAFLSATDDSWRLYSGPGLRDATRIAAGDPDLWRSILLSNREEVLRALRRLQDGLDEAHALIANDDAFRLRDLLRRGKAFRDALATQP